MRLLDGEGRIFLHHPKYWGTQVKPSLNMVRVWVWLFVETASQVSLWKKCLMREVGQWGTTDIKKGSHFTFSQRIYFSFKTFFALKNTPYRNSYTLDAGVGCWALNTALWTLGFGHWTLLTGSEQNQNQGNCPRRKLPPNPKTNPYSTPNPNPNWGAIVRIPLKILWVTRAT